MIKSGFYYLSACMLILAACNQQSSEPNQAKSQMMDTTGQSKQIGALLDSFNMAAANADYDKYFSFFADNAVFAGTDATERWNKKEFMVWAKPYFDKKTTWHFTSIDRHIYFDKTGHTAWFDELLNTQMKICRGSGVLSRDNGHWKIEQYILSMTVPNSQIEPAIKMKMAEEDSLIRQMQHQ